MKYGQAVWQNRSFHDKEYGILGLDGLRMLTKEEQMEPEKTCKNNETKEKRQIYMVMELSRKESSGAEAGIKL